MCALAWRNIGVVRGLWTMLRAGVRGLRAHPGRAVGFALTLALAAAAFAPMLVAEENTLLRNRAWNVAKLRVEMPMMGENSYLTGTQALARNRLNLDAWHGFHKVTYRPWLEPRHAWFRFRVAPDAYLVFSFNEDQETHHGFRFSALERPGFENMFYSADNRGGFLDTVPAPDARPVPNAWNTVEAEFHDEGAVTLRLNGTLAGRFLLPGAAAGRIGFRGGFAPAAVDALRVVDRGGTVHREDFAARDRYLGAWARGLGALALLAACCALPLGLWRRDAGALFGDLIAINLCAVAAGLTLSGYFVLVHGSLYPAATDPALQRIERGQVAERIRRMREDLAAVHARAAAPGVRRVLFLGTSQTWGAGAHFREDAFVARVAGRFEEAAAGGGAVEVINCGVPGAYASELLEAYAEDWIGFGPDLVVVNLGVNDEAREDFPESLRALAALNAAAGIQTLFIDEAYACEAAGGERKDSRALHAAAEAMGIPVLDAFACMRARVGEGFLWWDFVHPTSFGHGVLADCVYPAVRAALEGELHALVPESPWLWVPEAAKAFPDSSRP